MIIDINKNRVLLDLINENKISPREVVGSITEPYI